MALPPLWKISREIDRGRQALHALIAHLYEPFLQRHHDRNRDRLLKLYSGQVPYNGQVALLLVYQPNGFSPTLRVTCVHLVESGYAPLIVCNSDPSAADVESLKDCAWTIMVRPNFGYDFGGYRDGILWLLKRKNDLKRLIVLNDSIWFPAFAGDQLISRLEGLGVDVAGAVLHPAHRRRRTSRLRPAFLESYFYLFGEKAIQSEAFLRFWRKFRVSSIKLNAVYRGERSFSVALERAGLSIDAVLNRHRILAALTRSDAQFLETTLQYGAYVDPTFEAEAAALLARHPKDAGWKEAALAHMDRVLTRRSSYASFPYATLHLFNVSFLKKSRAKYLGASSATVHAAARRQVLRAINAKVMPPPYPEVLAELLAFVDESMLGVEYEPILVANGGQTDDRKK
jgi:hypothetical protein